MTTPKTMKRHVIKCTSRDRRAAIPITHVGHWAFHDSRSCTGKYLDERYSWSRSTDPNPDPDADPDRFCGQIQITIVRQPLGRSLVEIDVEKTRSFLKKRRFFTNVHVFDTWILMIRSAARIKLGFRRWTILQSRIYGLGPAFLEVPAARI